MLEMKTTSNRRQPQNIESWIYQQPVVRFSSNFNQSLGDQTKMKMLKTKMAYIGRRPQNIKSWISQQPLIRFSSNFELKLTRPNQNHKCLKGRRPSMEEDLKTSQKQILVRK